MKKDRCIFLKGRESEIGRINEILRLSKGYWGYDERFMRSFMNLYSIDSNYLNENIVYCCYLEDILIGFYSFFFTKDGKLELDCFFLHPEYFGQGIGRLLWDSACQTAKDLGYRSFIILADPNAEDFYIKMGCKRIGTEKSPLLATRELPLLSYSRS